MPTISRFTAALRRRWLPLILLFAAAGATLVVTGQTALPLAINLSSDPLFAAAGGDKPTMALALSVEFPTVGAQYVASPGANSDSTYSNLNEYLGYYDAESCYTYNNTPTETPTGGSVSDYKRFDRSGAATNRMCTNAFSGNFLNWASSSAIDMLRLALSGGDRLIDTASLTILQRAVIPNGDPICMWNSGNFPAKELQKDGGGAGKYWGAVPSAMIDQAAGSSIWVANTLNRIYFGTRNTGNCGSTSSYILGSNVPQTGPVTTPYATAPTGISTFYPKCADDFGFCNFTGTMEVLYGNAAGGWLIYPASNGIQCYVSSGFIDPVPGVLKQCYLRPYTGTWKPSATGATKQVGPVTSPYATASTGFSTFYAPCASEGGSCNFSGTMEVLYGNPGGGWLVYPAYGGISCGIPPGGNDPANGIVKQCYLRPYTGTWSPSTIANSLNTDGFFYSRVQVCNAASGVLQDARDYGLCQQYPNGNYKPTGSIHKYSDQLRLAAFGYLMDQTASYSSGGRYGGVLRVPMKFVGAKTFDISGQENTPTTGNPNAEWSASTGVFVSNPDANTDQTVPISGVINYLNKFGRTGPVAGRYKRYDPVGELHYEALRYLQGLQPSADAVSGLTDPKSDLYDGFPVSKTWTDPYGGARSSTADYSCLKSNIVVVGDVNTHDGNRLPATNLAANIPDISGWRTIVQNFERNATSTYTDGQGASRTTANPNAANGNPPSGTQTSQILGTSYWSHTHDIRGTDWTGSVAQQRPGLRVKNFFFDVNENGSSNNVSYRRNNNQFFTAAKYGGFETDASNGGGRVYNTKGNPFQRQDGTNDNNVWQSSTAAGEAGAYYLQSNARGVLQAFDNIFSRASTSARSIAGSAVASKTLTSAGTLIYQSSFDTSDWSGDVLAFSLSTSGTTAETVNTTIGDTATWKASTRLNALTAPATSRNIVIGRSGATATPTAQAFTWGTIDDSIKTDLRKLTTVSAADSATVGEERLNYLRGSKAKEGTSYRARSNLLGDIVNSGVTYSGAPTVFTGTDSTFTGFITANASRTPAVFVGANDGMLHSFNALTGDELFGYIPSWMSPKLAALTALTYNSNHQAYVDASPAISEAKLGTAGTSADWKTVLVSGTGAGGSGVFALDITNPSAFTSSNVLWEFTRSSDTDIGNVVGRPQIVKMRTSAPNATTPTYRWFAAVASGVNNYVADANSGSTLKSSTGKPALFLLALDKPTGTAWTLNTNYYKISLPVDSTLIAANPTGLVNFKTTFGAAGEVSKVYMGDLHGKMWKLDFAARGAADWTMDKLSAYNSGTVDVPVAFPMFIAKTSAGVIQPITMPPLLAAGPVANGINTTIVAFGTGKYLETADKTSTFQNSFYSLFDDGTATADLPVSPAGTAVIRDRNRLQAATLNTTTKAVVVPTFKWGRATSSTDATQRSGWYFDLGTSGERMVTAGAIDGNDFVLGSLIPASSGAVGSCTASGGSGNTYELNIDDGNGVFSVSTVGLLGQTVLINLSDATQYTVSTGTGRRVKTLATQKVSTGSSAMSPSGVKKLDVISGRLSWRQINNYQDLKGPTP